jgi:hypothetical protein
LALTISSLVKYSHNNKGLAERREQVKDAGRCAQNMAPELRFLRAAKIDNGIIDLDRDAEIPEAEESKYDLKRSSPTTRLHRRRARQRPTSPLLSERALTEFARCTALCALIACIEAWLRSSPLVA